MNVTKEAEIKVDFSLARYFPLKVSFLIRLKGSI